MSKKDSPIVHIYYDGNCPMCNIFAETVSKHDKDQILLDANKETNEKPASTEELLKEIHLVEIDGTVRTGADAIFTSLARIYPILRPTSYLIRLPIINWIVKYIYLFISKRRVMWLGGDTARLYWLFLITNIGLLAGIILSWPAWGLDRNYPLTPILSNIDWLNPITWLLTTGLIISLTLSLIQTKHFRYYTLISLLFLTPLVLLDITRLQPWMLHYAGLLFLLSFINLYSTLRTSQILDAARFIVVGIYFWSGVQKMNTGFVLEVFPWFTKTLWSPFGDIGATTVIIIGIFVPFVEAAFALGLLTRRFRFISIVGSGVMLVTVTLSIMIGHGWNSVVWPWNFAIFSMILILFYRYEDSVVDLFRRTKKNLLGIFAIFIFILLPLGNFFGLVDHYLSWSLYSNHVPTATITASKETLNQLASNITEKNSEVGELKVLHWSIETMNVVPYPQERVFFNLFSNLCTKYSDQNLMLTITTRPRLFTNNPTNTNYDCTLKPLSIAE